jgi:membrane-associated protease RseP (regulator of RpoE activity)
MKGWRAGLVGMSLVIGGGALGSADPEPRPDPGPPKGKRGAREAFATQPPVFGITLGKAKGTGLPTVVALERRSPAVRAGLRRGDEIVRVQGTPVSDPRTAARILSLVPVGHEVRIEARRTAAPVSVSFWSPHAALLKPTSKSGVGAEAKPAAPMGRKAKEPASGGR